MISTSELCERILIRAFYPLTEILRKILFYDLYFYQAQIYFNKENKIISRCKVSLTAFLLCNVHNFRIYVSLL